MLHAARADIVTVTIERAAADDLDAVIHLLEQQGLPPDGARELANTMVIARAAGEVVGAAALEPYADGAFLRSVVVAPALQRRGVGGQLVEAALALASERGTSTVFLLTMNAAGYFRRFGFERIARAEVPASVRASVQFQSACPDSAIAMRRVG